MVVPGDGLMGRPLGPLVHTTMTIMGLGRDYDVRETNIQHRVSVAEFPTHSIGSSWNRGVFGACEGVAREPPIAWSWTDTSEAVRGEAVRGEAVRGEAVRGQRAGVRKDEVPTGVVDLADRAATIVSVSE